MRRICFFAVLLLATVTAGVSHAASGFECVKAQCEGKGRGCVEALYVTYNACAKAARAKCDKVSAAEKFNCLRSELTPCAQTRNKEQAACLADARSCYQACAPFPGKQVRYWCVADTQRGATAAFCEANPGSSPFDQCAKAFGRATELTGSMTCESLH